MILYIMIVPLLVFVLLLLNVLFSVSRPDHEKLSSYECGFTAIGHQTRRPFNIQYYLVGILFLVFDLEIAIFYPLAVRLYQISFYGFWIRMFFLLLLTIGFVYEYGKGALTFTDHRRSINPINSIK